MLPVDADFLLVIDSSSEKDSERDDQSYPPPEVHALTWQGYVAHIVRKVSCIAMSFACVSHLTMSSCTLHLHVFKTCICPGSLSSLRCPF